MSFTRFKKYKNRNSKKAFKFDKVSWSTAVCVQHARSFALPNMGREGSKQERVTSNHIFLMGGCKVEERRVSNQTLELQQNTGFVIKRPNMPFGKFAHGAVACCDQIIVTGGISDLMLNMGMRSVPLGDNECYTFNFYQNQWRNLPEIPVGKLHPTLIALGSRYVFQIGGFDDINFDIYRLDMRH